MAEALLAGGYNPETLKNIMEDLEEMKQVQAGGIKKDKNKADYKYLDDKTLYSTDWYIQYRE